jgi:hypothetical protein
MTFDELNADNPYQYRLRWRFDFLNHTSKFGPWDVDAVRLEDKACRQMKEGLIRACVEGKNRATGEIRVMHEVDGHDFVNFAWEALFFANVKGSHAQQHVGLQLVSREHITTVRFSGKVEKQERTEQDKKRNFGIWGK